MSLLPVHTNLKGSELIYDPTLSRHTHERNIDAACLMPHKAKKNLLWPLIKMGWTDPKFYISMHIRSPMQKSELYTKFVWLHARMVVLYNDRFFLHEMTNMHSLYRENICHAFFTLNPRHLSQQN